MLIGLGIFAGLIIGIVCIVQLLGFIYIVLNNLFSSSLHISNEFENRVEYGVGSIVALFGMVIILFICYMIGTVIIS